MPGRTEAGPNYISPQSADVILSDARPVKLKGDALSWVNALLDELLHKILTSAGSYITNRLRSGLLAILPTSLGKEALLEAEVELRAYWDRTKPANAQALQEEDRGAFGLEWAFELLRLKVEAYFTLNENDEDPAEEEKVIQGMAGAGLNPPSAALVAPAALYLTAIMESVCEHILMNVGRVIARDSSRATASIQDLFIALCEDTTVYDFFKTMDVYEQIEIAFKTPTPRRSKSFTRNDRLSTSSPHHDGSSSTKDTPPSTRLSSETNFATHSSLSMSSSRTSVDKPKGPKRFIGRGSTEAETHRRSDSAASEDIRQTLAAYEYGENSLQEFDNLMRSDATMKVSLTPDRLKTMEAYKQEKDRGKARPSPLLANRVDPEPSSSPSSRTHGKRPSIRNVDSILEDEEETNAKSPNSRTRQGSLTSSHPPPAFGGNRSRSHSTSNPSSRLAKPTSKSNLNPLPSPPMPTNDFRSPFPSNDAMPQRTRRVQKNRESLDLDDVMGGSDDEIDDSPAREAKPAPLSPVVRRTTKVSQSTRDLMAFLEEGPPDAPKTPKVSRGNQDLMDFLAGGPPDQPMSTSVSAPESIGKSNKGSGRLQRMISKLSLNASERGKGAQSQVVDDAAFRGTQKTGTAPNTPIRGEIIHKGSVGQLSSLANRPIPPRPRPISPPSSNEDHPVPIHQRRDLPSEAPKPSTPTQRRDQFIDPPQHSPAGPASRQFDTQQQVNGTNGIHRAHPNVPSAINGMSPTAASHAFPPASVAAPVASANTTPRPQVEQIVTKRQPTKSLPSAVKRKAVVGDSSGSTITPADAQDLRKLMSRATSVDECKLITDMFLARAGLPMNPVDYDVPYPSPSLSDKPEKEKPEVLPSTVDGPMEGVLVELFLAGGNLDALADPPLRKKRHISRKKAPPPPPPAQPSQDTPQVADPPRRELPAMPVAAKVAVQV